MDRETESHLDRKSFLRHFAAQLNTLASVSVCKERVDGLAHVFRDLTWISKKKNFTILAQFSRAMERMLIRVGEKTRSELKFDQADVLLKGAIFDVQDFIYQLSQGETLDQSRERLKSQILKALTFEKELQQEDLRMSALQGSGAQESSPELEWALLEKSVDQSVNQHAKKDQEIDLEAQRLKKEKLLKTISNLAERIDEFSRLGQKEKIEFREKSSSLVKKAQEHISVSFEEICQSFMNRHSVNIVTDTPQALVEELDQSAIESQLEIWLDTTPKQDSNLSVSCTLRRMGRELCLELRYPNPIDPIRGDFGRIEHTQRLKKRADHVDRVEAYRTATGLEVRRAYIELTLPVCELFEVRYADHSFFLPLEDVVEQVEQFDQTLFIEDLLQLPTPWKSRKPARDRESILLRMRGKWVQVVVDEVMGPKTFFTRAISRPSTRRRGVDWMVNDTNFGSGALLDLYAWLEEHEERTIQKEFQETGEQPIQGAFAVVGISGRRYAIPSARVLSWGRLKHKIWMGKVLKTSQGIFPLKDLKEVLGIEDEAGSNYIIVETRRGPIAWVVDGVEPNHFIERGRLKPVTYFGRQVSHQTVRGLITQPDKRAVGGGVVNRLYLLNLDALSPDRAKTALL